MLSDDLIYLRKLDKSDLDRTWEWINKPDVFWKIGVNVPVSKSAQQQWFEQVDCRADKIIFAICFRAEDWHVGNISLDMIDFRHRNARLSIFIGDSAQRGKGIGSRAISLLARYAFDFLNLHRIWCKTSAQDSELLRFYQRMGFRVEGRLRHHEFIDGQYVDKTILGILREEFKHAHRS